MMNLLKFLDARFGEPSTYSGIAALLLLVHLNVDAGTMSTVTTWGVVVSGLLAILLREWGSKPPAAIAGDVLAALAPTLQAMQNPPAASATGTAPAAGVGVPATAPAVASSAVAGAGAATGTAAATGVLALIAAGLTLAACSSTSLSTAQADVTAATPAVATLAGLAAANNTTVADLVVKGQLFCQAASGPVAVADAVGDMTSFASVINASATAVSDVCAAVDAVPVPPPATIPLASVPVVTTQAAAALAPAVTP